MLAKIVNDNAALSGSPWRLFVLREQARSYRGFGFNQLLGSNRQVMLLM